MDWITRIKAFFRSNDALVGIIAVNVAVFVIYHIIHMFFMLFGADGSFPLNRWLSVPADPLSLITHPWTLLTYMFLHEGILHLLVNMLWLYWFGSIFRKYFSGWQLVNVYILAGFAGAALYVLSYNIFPAFAVEKHFSLLLGASAGVLGIVMAIACYAPRFTVQLLLIGRIRLIHIALASLALDVISISASNNAGGHIAHIGGALFGYLFARNIQKGRDITAPFGKFCARIANLFKRRERTRMRVVISRPPADDREYNAIRNANQAEIDRILDKISIGGYDSLTRQEKEILFHQRK